MTDNDHIKNALIAASSAVPVVGGPIAIILDKYLPSEIETRKNDLIRKLSEDLEKIKDSIDPGKLESEEYLTIFLKILRRTMEDNRKEKTIAFRNILINQTISKSTEFDEVSFYIRLIEDLTIDQIRILHFIYKNKLYGSCSYNEELNIYQDIQKIWPTVDKHYLQACVTELIRFFIITSSKEVLKKKNEKGHALTEFGERFIKHIFSPIEFNEAQQNTAADPGVSGFSEAFGF